MNTRQWALIALLVFCPISFCTYKLLDQVILNKMWHPRPEPSPSPLPITKCFDPKQVTEFKIKDHGFETSFNRQNEGWKSSTPFEIFNVERRLIVLAALPLQPGNFLKTSFGEITLTIGGEKWQGRYNKAEFIWETGPQKLQQMVFKKDSPLKYLLFEGIEGFAPHHFSVCSEKSISNIKHGDNWELKRSGAKWLVIEKNKPEVPAKIQAVKDWLNGVCQVEIDFFDSVTEGQLQTALELSGSAKTVKIETMGDLIKTPGHTPFLSEKMQRLLNFKADDFKDRAFDDSKIALDKNEIVKTRTDAIRRLKDARSPEGMDALRNVLFEETEFDVFRYEACDALASYGTKEAYALIAKRLSTEGRTGFQLRLARALGTALGMPFKSDEKTPDAVRQPEVQKLLAAFKARPPGI